MGTESDVRTWRTDLKHNKWLNWKNISLWLFMTAVAMTARPISVHAYHEGVLTASGVQTLQTWMVVALAAALIGWLAILGNAYLDGEL